MEDYKLKLRNLHVSHTLGWSSHTHWVGRLTHTGLVVELEHLEIETRLIDEKFANVMGEYVT